MRKFPHFFSFFLFCMAPKKDFVEFYKKKNRVTWAYIPGWRSFKIIWQFDLDLELTLSPNKQYLSCEQQWKLKMK